MKDSEDSNSANPIDVEKHGDLERGRTLPSKKLSHGSSRASRRRQSLLPDPSVRTAASTSSTKEELDSFSAAANAKENALQDLRSQGLRANLSNVLTALCSLLPVWVLKNLTVPRLKPVFRCAFVAWISILFVVNYRTDRILGQVTVTCIILAIHFLFL